MAFLDETGLATVRSQINNLYVRWDATYGASKPLMSNHNDVSVPTTQNVYNAISAISDSIVLETVTYSVTAPSNAGWVYRERVKSEAFTKSGYTFKGITLQSASYPDNLHFMYSYTDQYGLYITYYWNAGGALELSFSFCLIWQKNS